MERLPVPMGEEDVLTPIPYSASSIADMVNNTNLVIAEKREEITRWEEGLYGLHKITAFPTIWKVHEMMKPPGIFAAAVNLPAIRHFPQKDNTQDTNTITIFDPTAEIEVRFPKDGNLVKLTREMEKATGITFDPKLLKARSWLSEVTLISIHQENIGSIYFLVFVKNHLASEPERKHLPLLTTALRRITI